MELEEQTLQLIDAVNITMNPEIDQESRSKAYQICENFKDTSPHCVACGAMLADVKHSPVIRHFGLQLLEHFVRFKWNDATVEQKLQFKNLTIEMITKKSTNVLEEENFIKEGPVKIVVEMIKENGLNNGQAYWRSLDQMCQIGFRLVEVFLRPTELSIGQIQPLNEMSLLRTAVICT
nr:exportin-5-like [Lytechinus pictus]